MDNPRNIKSYKAAKASPTAKIKGIKAAAASYIREIRENKSAFFFEIAIFALGFVLSRCSLFFGARPLGVALVSVLPRSVWAALAGAFLGGATKGLDGLILAIATLITTLLRAAVSVSASEDKRPFGENLLLKVSISVLGGFVVAVYEALMRGLNEATLLFGLVMILLTPLLTLILSGVFIDEICFPKADRIDIFDIDLLEGNKRFFYQLSSLFLVFFIGLSLKGVGLFGISFSYLFAALITLICARRMGGIPAMAVGFFSLVGISTTNAISYAISGLAAGVIMSFGTLYGLIAGGAVLCLWSSYSSGLNGLLSTLPEFLIAAALSLPSIKRSNDEPSEDYSEPAVESDGSAEEMVGTMALAYQSKFSGGVDSLEGMLSEIAGVVRTYTKKPVRLSAEEYREIVISAAEKRCQECEEKGLCSTEDIRPSIKSADKIATMLSLGKKISAPDINTGTEFCMMAELLAEDIRGEVGRRERENCVLSEIAENGEEYELISSLIRSAREADEREKAVNNRLTEALTQAFRDCGFKNGVIRAFGERRRHFILAGEDESGVKISSFELRKSIERAANVKLGTPEYFRKGKMVLMECDVRPRLKISYATATLCGSSGEVSGDTAVCFDSKDGLFYSLISDGMGSGEVAKETSEFVAEFIKKGMAVSPAKETLIHILNHSIRTGREECSATVDLFEIDLFDGSGSFLKSGAAPSYIKRDSSIFRIRSQTAPIGLMRSIDSEKINVEIREGDYIFMMSDGIAEIAEDAPWLLLLLGENPVKDLKDYAERIIKEARKNERSSDDMTVTVIHVEEA